MLIEVGKVTLDDREVELPQDRRRRLAVEQKLEAAAHEVLDGPACAPPLQVSSRDAYAVMGPRPAIFDAHLAGPTGPVRRGLHLHHNSRLLNALVP